MPLFRKATTQRQSRWVDEPVEKEVHRYGAEVPHSVSVEDPEHWGEVQQLQQGQAVKHHHHQAALPPVWQGPPVLPAPTQPPQEVHHAFKDKRWLKIRKTRHQRRAILKQ